MTAPVDTDRVRAAVSACPGVVRVHGRGPNGVAADDLEVEVHVIARYGVALVELGDLVDRELAPLLGGRTLRLVVDDVDDGPDDDVPADDGPDVPLTGHR